MHRVHILFGPPLDVAAFAKHFEATHRPLLDRVAGTKAVEVSWIVGALSGEMAVHLMVALVFKTEEALQDGLNSDAGQQMARDYPAFASGGVTILLSNSKA